MADFSQNNSPLQITLPLPPDTLLATRLTGWEELGKGYCFTVEALAKKGTPIPFGLLLGQPGTVKAAVAGGTDRFFSGIIWSLQKDRADDDFDYYTVVLRPALDRLGHTKRTRLFQDMSGLDIINTLLAPVGGSQNMIMRPVLPRAYCAQYRETDLEFFLRLCSEEGITFYWLHLPLVSTLVLTDNTTLTVPVMTIPFDPLGGGTKNDGARFTAWGFRQELGPTGVEIRDGHFQLAGMSLTGQAGAPSLLFGGGQPLRFPDSPGPWQEDNHSQARFFDGVAASGLPSLVPPIAGLLDEMQRSAAGRLVAGAVGSCVRSQGSGYCPLAAPGLGFILTECGDQNGPYVATRVEHRVEMRGRYYAGEGGALELETRVEAAPQMVPQAPWPPIAKPNVGGLHTAEVVGGMPGQEVHLDQYGRVRVKFVWDRDNGSAGTWVRVAQVWAGNGWGAIFWPRVGHEVVVAFEGGDPDRPLIVGSVYNAKNMPPYSLPLGAYTAGFKSCSQMGNPLVNYNHILMQDDLAQECLWLHAENQLLNEQENDMAVKQPRTVVKFQGG
jgi:type VI secretion system secreted protein VgrG